jgi:hypothetical protein
MLVSSEHVSKQSKNKRSVFGQHSGESFNDITVKCGAEIVASGHMLPVVLIFSGFDERGMPRFSDNDKSVPFLRSLEYAW